MLVGHKLAKHCTLDLDACEFFDNGSYILWYSAKNKLIGSDPGGGVSCPRLRDYPSQRHVFLIQVGGSKIEGAEGVIP